MLRTPCITELVDWSCKVTLNRSQRDSFYLQIAEKHLTNPQTINFKQKIRSRGLALSKLLNWEQVCWLVSSYSDFSKLLGIRKHQKGHGTWFLCYHLWAELLGCLGKWQHLFWCNPCHLFWDHCYFAQTCNHTAAPAVCMLVRGVDSIPIFLGKQ